MQRIVAIDRPKVQSLPLAMVASPARNWVGRFSAGPNPISYQALLIEHQHSGAAGGRTDTARPNWMSEFLLYYKRPDPTTWVYMSSFLTIGLFFVFHRFWSIRNLDVVLLILLAPGLLMVYEGRRRQLVESEVTAQQFRFRQLGRRPNHVSVRKPLSQRPLGDLGPLLGALPVFALTQNDSANAVTERNVTERDATDQADDLPSDPAEGPLDESNELGSDRDEASSPEDSQTQGPLIAGRYDPRNIQRWGFIYLFVVESLILLRLMLDPLMVRRPLLDPNLTTGGLNFIGISLFVFMMANVVTSNPRVQVEQGPELGPGYTLMNLLPAIPTRPESDQPGGAFPPSLAELTPQQLRLTTIAKGLAILAQMIILTGIVLISSRHFGNLRAGFGCATLYLLLPYTAQMTGRVDHALPAALLLLAILCYRRPLLAGVFLGLAGGLVYYPLFLLPLWVSFYWQRGVRSFSIGVASMLVLLVLVLAVDKTSSLQMDLQRMFGLLNPNRDAHDFRGIWALGWNPIWRLPVIVAFVILSTFFAIWPAQKNLGTLISGSAALLVAAQFWHGDGGGLYIAWFLPLLLLTIFRPNLQDRVATKVVSGSSPEPRKIGVSADRAELEPA
jgi:hypothetical protein